MKIWDDITKVNGLYVGKDVRTNVFALLGSLLLIVSCLSFSFVNNNYAFQAGCFLVVAALGGTYAKSYFQYKNNAVAAGTDGSDDNSVSVNVNATDNSTTEKCEEKI